METAIVQTPADPAPPAAVSPNPETAAAKPPQKTPPAAAAQARRAAVVPQNLRVSLDIDQDTHRVIATITDPETGEVIDQLPPENIVKLAASLRAVLKPVVDRVA